MTTASAYTYISDIVVDRSSLIHEDACKQIIDRLRHRMDAFGTYHQGQQKHDLLQGTTAGLTISKGGGSSTDFWATEVDDEASNDRNQDSMENHPFEALLRIIGGCELLARITVCKILLDQRAAVPLLLPSKYQYMSTNWNWPTLKKPHGVVEEVALLHNSQALSLVPVKVCNEIIIPSLVDDTILPRVLFLSTRSRSLSETAALASQVTNCHFVSQHGLGTASSVAVEMGVGFLPHKNITCLAFVVWGKFSEVAGFVKDIADMIIMEVEPAASIPSSLSNCKVLHWEINPREQGRDKAAAKIWGPLTLLSRQISRFICEHLAVAVATTRASHEVQSVKDICLSMFQPRQLIPIPGFPELLEEVQFETLRDELLLQRSYIKESHAWFQSPMLKHIPEERQARTLQCLEEREKRRRLAGQVWDHAMLQYFVRILRDIWNPEIRRYTLANLQTAMNNKYNCILESNMAARVDRHFLEFSHESSIDNRSRYDSCELDYVPKMMGLEHLWRELCHIFISNPSEFRPLPKLAASHLLDGFPLEILDGDAGMFCETWVATVINELEQATSLILGHKPKIFVLSMIGAQSSGKSTLLNIMFGTQLRTSAGQCTRGVYLQVIRSERPEYDYVLILDTEGIRCPEYHGLPDSNAHDNRMATFAILPADACIVMATNEDDTGLKEVLPMVMLAYQGSAMAEKTSGRLRAKIFFVYRSVDINDTKKLKANQQKLKEYLKEAAEKLLNPDEGVASNVEATSDLLHSMFSDFQVNNDAEKSDMKFLGNWRKGNLPPGDTPDWKYGEQVMRLREYIHGRVTKDPRWNAHCLCDWNEYISLVWQCVSEANFELSFKCEVENSAYLDLQDRLQHPRGKVSRKYMQEFEELETSLRRKRKPGNAREDAVSVEMLHRLLQAKVMVTVQEQSGQVHEILQEKHCQNWQVEETKKWEEFLCTQSNLYERQLQDCLDAVLTFDDVFVFYDQKMQEEIAKMSSSSIADCVELEQKQFCFKAMFESVIQEAGEKYEPLADRVPQHIDDIYRKHLVTSKFDVFTPRSWLDRANVRKMFSELFQYGKRDEKAEALETVKMEIESFLGDVRQYSHHLVELVINITNNHVAGLRKEAQEEVHYSVKQILTKSLQTIQKAWDSDHNIAAKLKLQEPRFRQLFDKYAMKVKRENMLLDELQRLIISRLDVAFQERLTKEVSGMLQSEEWVFNWKILRACLDLHLIALIERKQTNVLLELVCNGARHYRMVTHLLVGKKLKSVADSSWKRFLKDVRDAVEAGNDNAGIEEETSASILLERLEDRLVNCSKEFFFSVSRINANLYEGLEIRHNRVKEELCHQLMNAIEMPQLENEYTLQSLTESILEAMNRRFHNVNMRPRCTVSCPHCKLTCFHPSGHDNRITKHDTLHQSMGLAGWRCRDSKVLSATGLAGWRCRDSKVLSATGLAGWRCRDSKVLSERSCSQSVDRGDYFILDKEDGTEETHAYSEFDKVYSDWKLPSIKDCWSIQVREYIFYNFQEELVAKYCGTKKCISEMPAEYNHDLQVIRLHLTNLLPESLHKW